MAAEEQACWSEHQQNFYLLRSEPVLGVSVPPFPTRDFRPDNTARQVLLNHPASCSDTWRLQSRKGEGRGSAHHVTGFHRTRQRRWKPRSESETRAKVRTEHSRQRGKGNLKQIFITNKKQVRKVYRNPLGRDSVFLLGSRRKKVLGSYNVRGTVCPHALGRFLTHLFLVLLLYFYRQSFVLLAYFYLFVCFQTI